MPMILVTPLSQIEQTIRRYRPSHMVTLLSPEHMIETPQGIVADNHLRLGLNDIADALDGDVPPAQHHVDQLIAFGRNWDAKTPMLVHCWAGVSRSMAAAYILLSDRLGPGSEEAIARAMRLRAAHACPNALLVKLADQTLGRNGRMTTAIESIGRGRIVAEGEIVEFPVLAVEL